MRTKKVNKPGNRRVAFFVAMMMLMQVVLPVGTFAAPDAPSGNTYKQDVKIDADKGITYVKYENDATYGDEDTTTRNGDVAADGTPDALKVDKYLTKVDGTEDLYEMTLTLDGNRQMLKEYKYIVLTLDMTGSLCEECKLQANHSTTCAIARIRDSAKVFVDKVLEADENIKIAIVVFGRVADFAKYGDADTGATFTNSKEDLHKRIDALKIADPFDVSGDGETIKAVYRGDVTLEKKWNATKGKYERAGNATGTNMGEALRVSYDALNLFTEARADQKMVVLFTDGEPNTVSNYKDKSKSTVVKTEIKAKDAQNQDIVYDVFNYNATNLKSIGLNQGTESAKETRTVAKSIRDTGYMLKTIGFNKNGELNSSLFDLLREISSDKTCYSAGDAAGIATAFAELFNSLGFKPLAENIKLKDIIPEEYVLVPYSPGENFKYTAPSTLLGTLPQYNEASKTITWGNRGTNLSTNPYDENSNHVTIKYQIKPNYSVIYSKLVDEKGTFPTNVDGIDNTYVEYLKVKYNQTTRVVVGEQKLLLPVPELSFKYESNGIKVEKTSAETVNAGTDITFKIVVTNNSRYVSKNFVFKSDELQLDDAVAKQIDMKDVYTLDGKNENYLTTEDEVFTIAPNGSMTFYYDYATTDLKADKDSKNTVKNTVVVQETDDTGKNNVGEPETGNSTTTVLHPGVSIEKKANKENVKVNEDGKYSADIDYEITVKNTGATELTGVKVYDPYFIRVNNLKVGGTDAVATLEKDTAYVTIGEMAVGDEVVITYTATLTLADKNTAEKFENTATVKVDDIEKESKEEVTLTPDFVLNHEKFVTKFNGFDGDGFPVLKDALSDNYKLTRENDEESNPIKGFDASEKAKYDEAKAVLAEAKKALADLEEAFETEFGSDYASYANEVAALEVALVDAQKTFDDAEADLEALEEDKTDAEAKVSDYKEALILVETTDIDELNEKVTDLTDAIADIDEKLSVIETKKSELDINDENYDADLEALELQASELNEEKDEKSVSLNDAKDEIKAYEAAEKVVADSDIEALELAVEAAESAILEFEAEHNLAETGLATAKAAVEAVNTEDYKAASAGIEEAKIKTEEAQKAFDAINVLSDWKDVADSKYSLIYVMPIVNSGGSEVDISIKDVFTGDFLYTRAFSVTGATDETIDEVKNGTFNYSGATAVTVDVKNGEYNLAAGEMLILFAVADHFDAKEYTNTLTVVPKGTVPNDKDDETTKVVTDEKQYAILSVEKKVAVADSKDFSNSVNIYNENYVTYKITVTNNGDAVGTFSIKDTLNGESVLFGGFDVTIEPGETLTYDMIVAYGKNNIHKNNSNTLLNGSNENKVEITTTDDKTIISKDTDYAYVNVTERTPEIVVEKGVSDGTVYAEQEINYSIRTTVKGTEAVKNVTLTDAMFSEAKEGSLKVQVLGATQKAEGGKTFELTDVTNWTLEGNVLTLGDEFNPGDVIIVTYSVIVAKEYKNGETIVNKVAVETEGSVTGTPDKKEDETKSDVYETKVALDKKVAAGEIDFAKDGESVTWQKSISDKISAGSSAKYTYKISITISDNPDSDTLTFVLSDVLSKDKKEVSSNILVGSAWYDADGTVVATTTDNQTVELKGEGTFVTYITADHSRGKYSNVVSIEEIGGSESEIEIPGEAETDVTIGDKIVIIQEEGGDEEEKDDGNNKTEDKDDDNNNNNNNNETTPEEDPIIEEEPIIEDIQDEEIGLGNMEVPEEETVIVEEPEVSEEITDENVPLQNLPYTGVDKTTEIAIRVLSALCLTAVFGAITLIEKKLKKNKAQ